jgi:hypothetical protein
MNRRDFLKFLGALPFAPEMLANLPVTSPTQPYEVVISTGSPSGTISPSPAFSGTPSLEEDEDA